MAMFVKCMWMCELECKGWCCGVPRMLIWSCNVSTYVSLCRWFVGVVCVQPVMIHRALLCVVCRVLW